MDFAEMKRRVGVTDGDILDVRRPTNTTRGLRAGLSHSVCFPPAIVHLVHGRRRVRANPDPVEAGPSLLKSR